MKKTKKTGENINMKINLCLWIRRICVVKISILCEVTNHFNTILIKIIIVLRK